MYTEGITNNTTQGRETMERTVNTFTKAQNKLINEVLDSQFNKVKVHGSAVRTARKLAELGFGTVTVDRTLDSFTNYELSYEDFKAVVSLVSKETFSFGSFATYEVKK